MHKNINKEYTVTACYEKKILGHSRNYSKKDSMKKQLRTYFIIEVAGVITMRVKYIFTEARPYLIDILIPHSMQQKVRIAIVLPIANFCIEAFSSLLILKKFIYFSLQF